MASAWNLDLEWQMPRKCQGSPELPAATPVTPFGAKFLTSHGDAAKMAGGLQVDSTAEDDGMNTSQDLTGSGSGEVG
jgi:hypothetical protein